MGEQLTVQKAMELIRKSQGALGDLSDSVHEDDKGTVTICVNTAQNIRECLIKFQQILLDASVVIP